MQSWRNDAFFAANNCACFRASSSAAAATKNSSESQSLLLTMEDGSTSEINGVVTKLKEAEDLNGRQDPGPLSIQEIGENTMEREIKKSKVEAAPPEKVRMVPILLPDGKMLQRDPDETMQIQAEFINYSHEVVSDLCSRCESPRS